MHIEVNNKKRGDITNKNTSPAAIFIHSIDNNFLTNRKTCVKKRQKKYF